MEQQTFDARAGFHLATAGTDRSVLLAEQIGELERNRIQVANEPEIIRLENVLAMLEAERLQLQAVVGAARRILGIQGPWPVWKTVALVVFVTAGFALTWMSLAAFGFNPVLTCLGSVGIACLCAYATAALLDNTKLEPVVLGIAIVLFIASLTGLALLANIRGDVFMHHLQELLNTADGTTASPSDTGLAFYTAVAPKMRVFLTLVSLALELAAGLALHEIKAALKARALPPSPESRRLEVLESDISQTEAALRFLRNEPEQFHYEYRRNLRIGLLVGAARHTGASGKWPTIALLALLAVHLSLRAQPVDLVEGLDVSATSAAKDYSGATADSENIDAAARVLATLPPGSRVMVAGISDDSFSRPLVLLTGLIPSDPGKLPEYDEIAAARNRLSRSLRRIGISIQPRFQSTDILGFLVFAGMVFDSAPGMRRVLVIHSDMRQSARPLDLEHVPVIPVESALGTAQDAHLMPDLSGVEVFVYGVHAVGKDIRYWQSLREFWAAYFARCHARLRAFSMMRDVPNFAAAR